MKKWGIFLIGLIVGAVVSCECSVSFRSAASDETPLSKSTKPLGASGEGAADATAVLFPNTKSNKRFWRQAERDARHISVRTANHIHRTLIVWMGRLMGRQMPKELGLQLEYGGLIGGTCLPAPALRA